MRKREIEKLKKRLDERREQLTEKSARMAGESRQTVSEGGEDYVDDAVTHYTREFLLSMSDLDRKQLAQVEQALVRIRKGEFGECLVCGDEIGEKRLEAIPWAAYCVSCQEEAEREELTDQAHLWGLGGDREEAPAETAAPATGSEGGSNNNDDSEDSEGSEDSDESVHDEEHDEETADI